MASHNDLKDLQEKDMGKMPIPLGDMGTMPMPLGLESAAIEVGGMTCASCVAHVEKAARSVPGVRDSQVNLARGRASVTFDPGRTDVKHIADAITGIGYPAVPEDPGISAGNAEEQRLQRQMHHAREWFRRAVVGIILWLPIELTHWVMQF